MDWISKDGRLIWSEGWQAHRTTPFSLEELKMLKRMAMDHLIEIQKEIDNGKPSVPAMAWVLVDRILVDL